MSPSLRTVLRIAATALLAGLLPLRAQLDPRLQSSKTDFLDLYQQSASFKVKPEIMTIFDFSGSMQALMFHPEFNNTDTQDTQASVSLTAKLTGTPGTYAASVSLNFGGSIATLTSTKLVRPDGSLVTEANINANYVATTLQGETASPKATDIRNWLRSASHVRFAYGTRTVDVPLPWKILGNDSSVGAPSTGYPLSSFTVLDQTTVTNPDGSTSTYGSGTQIEMDRTYLISGGSSVFSGGAGVVAVGTSVTFSQVRYKQFYLQWLMNGKYTSGVYNGKYVVFDAANATLAGGQGALAWGQGFGTFGASDTITSTAQGGIAVPARTYVIPARNRCQAVKEASIRTWIKYQKSVFWSYRFLDPSNEASSGSATTINNNCTTWDTAADPTTTAVSGLQSAWHCLNADSLGNMKRIASLFPGGNTPLTYAVSRGLAQYNSPNNPFLSVETGADAPVQCQYKFLIVFTDGIDNNGTGTNNTNAASPYLGGGGGTTGNAWDGNATLLSNPTNINRSYSWWNLFTFAGIAAHLADSNLKIPPVPPATVPTPAQFMDPPASQPAAGTSGVPSTFLPFCVQARGSVTYKAPHRLVTTMSVGVSLGGTYSDTTGPKYRLFSAACIGDPSRTSWDLNTLTPFTLNDPNDPSKGKTSSSVYYFDATNPDLLTKSLDYAVLEAGKRSNINVTNAPTLPYIGATFGKQIYIGKFQPPLTGGTIWDGDLLAFTTRESATGIDILDSGGNPTTTLDSTTAIWSAKQYLTAPASGGPNFWSSRKLFTRIPGSAGTPEPGLTSFSDAGYPSSTPFSTISPYVATALTTAQKRTAVQFMAGGDTSGTLDAGGRPTANRSSIMGDVINSSPAAIEYTSPVWFSGSLPATLSSFGNRFRMVFVGTNQGWLHAFGEASQVTTVSSLSGPQEIVVAHAAELWAFMPTDFLAKLDYVTSTNNPHRFMVDGTPIIYHLDVPPSSGAPANGTVDNGERAMVLFGLRKGGRSYYAIDISNPTSPVLRWSLVPDEAASFGVSASRIVPGGPSAATVTAILKNFAFSTATPSIGRVLYNGNLRDAVFFSGGLSLPEIEANFTGTPKMGRSVLAVDAWSGAFLAAVDLTATTNFSLPGGLVPFEFILNSGMAQRAYFLDNGGGLWAWGSMKTLSGAPYDQYRSDSSDLAEWTTTGLSGGTPGIRKVAQDGTANIKYTTLPAPFRVGAFPGDPKVAGNAPPAAVGVAMVSGDRNNPLDYTIGGAVPGSNRMTVVFDRQDSKAWGLDGTGILDGQLANFTGQSNPSAPQISPTNSSYYLKNSGSPSFGYFATFPAAAGTFRSKGIVEPMVVAGSLFYTYFDPSEADPCSGGDGISHSQRICDVMNPILNDPRAGLGCTSGEVATYSGVSTGYVAYGTRGVIQSGVTSAGGSPGGTTTTPRIDRFTGQQTERFPKPRVWRTVR